MDAVISLTIAAEQAALARQMLSATWAGAIANFLVVAVSLGIASASALNTRSARLELRDHQLRTALNSAQWACDLLFVTLPMEEDALPTISYHTAENLHFVREAANIMERVVALDIPDRESFEAALMGLNVAKTAIAKHERLKKTVSYNKAREELSYEMDCLYDFQGEIARLRKKLLRPHRMGA